MKGKHSIAFGPPTPLNSSPLHIFLKAVVSSLILFGLSSAFAMTDP